MNIHGNILQYVFKLTIMKTTSSLLASTLDCSPVFDETIGSTTVVERKDRLGAIVGLNSSQSCFFLDPGLKASLFYITVGFFSKGKQWEFWNAQCESYSRAVSWVGYGEEEGSTLRANPTAKFHCCRIIRHLIHLWWLCIMCGAQISKPQIRCPHRNTSFILANWRRHAVPTAPNYLNSVGAKGNRCSPRLLLTFITLHIDF